MLVDDRVPVGRDPAHHRHGDRHGLGADAVGLLAHARRGDDRRCRAARRVSWLPRSWRSSCWARCSKAFPAIVLFGPLLFPIARAVGIHEVHYAMVVILAMGIGLFAPPFGVGYYAACAIGRVEPAAGHATDLGLHAGLGHRHDRRRRPLDFDRISLNCLRQHREPQMLAERIKASPRRVQSTDDIL